MLNRRGKFGKVLFLGLICPGAVALGLLGLTLLQKPTLRKLLTSTGTGAGVLGTVPTLLFGVPFTIVLGLVVSAVGFVPTFFVGKLRDGFVDRLAVPRVPEPPWTVERTVALLLSLFYLPVALAWRLSTSYFVPQELGARIQLLYTLVVLYSLYWVASSPDSTMVVSSFINKCNKNSNKESGKGLPKESGDASEESNDGQESDDTEGSNEPGNSDTGGDTDDPDDNLSRVDELRLTLTRPFRSRKLLLRTKVRRKRAGQDIRRPVERAVDTYENREGVNRGEFEQMFEAITRADSENRGGTEWLDDAFVELTRSTGTVFFLIGLTWVWFGLSKGAFSPGTDGNATFFDIFVISYTPAVLKIGPNLTVALGLGLLLASVALLFAVPAIKMSALVSACRTYYQERPDDPDDPGDSHSELHDDSLGLPDSSDED